MQAPSNAIESCKLLFEFGVGAGLLDVQSKSGSTALHMATEQKRIEVCLLLLQCGAGEARPFALLHRRSNLSRQECDQW